MAQRCCYVLHALIKPMYQVHMFLSMSTFPKLTMKLVPLEVSPAWLRMITTCSFQVSHGPV